LERAQQPCFFRGYAEKNRLEAAFSCFFRRKIHAHPGHTFCEEMQGGAFEMADYRIFHSPRLSGEVWIGTAKNAVLPIMAGALLTEEECVNH